MEEPEECFVSGFWTFFYLYQEYLLLVFLLLLVIVVILFARRQQKKVMAHYDSAYDKSNAISLQSLENQKELINLVKQQNELLSRLNDRLGK